MAVKKDDTVLILVGDDKGKKGKVLQILPKKGKVRVQGVAFATHYKKPRRQGEKGGIVKEERFIDISNVKLA